MALADLQAELAKWTAARDKILTSGQEYRTSELSNRRGDLKVIQENIQSLEMQIARIQGQTTTYPLFGKRP